MARVDPQPVAVPAEPTALAEAAETPSPAEDTPLAGTQDACPSCDASVNQGERFCAGCGTSLSDGMAPSRLLETARPGMRDALTQGPVAAEAPASDAPSAPRAKWGGARTAAIAGVAALILVGGGIAFYPTLRSQLTSGASDTATVSSSTDSSAANAPQAAAPAEMVTVYAMRLTRMRDAPTSQGSNVVGNLNRGEAATGTWVMGYDATTRWLKIARPGQVDAYAWGTNLSFTPRPVATRLIGEDRAAVSGATVYAEPRVASTWVENIAPGGIVTVSALVLGDEAQEWSEIALRSGGVGYVRANLLSTIAANATAIDGSYGSLAFHGSYTHSVSNGVHTFHVTGLTMQFVSNSPVNRASRIQLQAISLVATRKVGNQWQVLHRNSVPLALPAMDAAMQITTLDGVELSIPAEAFDAADHVGLTVTDGQVLWPIPGEMKATGAATVDTGKSSTNSQDLREMWRQAQDSMGRSDYAPAIAMYDRMIALKPNDGMLYNARCWARVMKHDLSNANLNAAMNDCNTALSLRPNEAYILDSRGMVYLEMRQYGSAITDFDSAIRVKALANSYYGRGIARLARGDRYGARADFLNARALEANIGRRFEQLGMNVDPSLTQ